MCKGCETFLKVKELIPGDLDEEDMANLLIKIYAMAKIKGAKLNFKKVLGKMKEAYLHFLLLNITSKGKKESSDVFH
jgi:hypothetical protein